MRYHVNMELACDISIQVWLGIVMGSLFPNEIIVSLEGLTVFIRYCCVVLGSKMFLIWIELCDLKFDASLLFVRRVCAYFVWN